MKDEDNIIKKQHITERVASHKLRSINSEGDLFVADCLGCSWQSEGFDTRKEAREAHADHVLSEKLRVQHIDGTVADN